MKVKMKMKNFHIHRRFLKVWHGQTPATLFVDCSCFGVGCNRRMLAGHQSHSKDAMLPCISELAVAWV